MPYAKRSMERLMILYRVKGKRAQGKTPARWSDDIKKAVGSSMFRAVHTAEDLMAWRNIVYGREQ